MTMPTERTRALRWAGEFLQEIRQLPGIDPELKRQAQVILRHYPTNQDMQTWAASSSQDKFGMIWLAPENESAVRP